MRPGGLAEPEVLHLGEQSRLAEHVGDLARADVGGLGQDLGRGQLLGGVRSRRRGRSSRRAGSGRAPRTPVLGLMSPSWRAAENGDELEDRARLVGLADGQVRRRLAAPATRFPGTSPKPLSPATRLAMARMSPVRVSSTIACRPGVGGRDLRRRAPFSVTYWSGWSSVSSRPGPVLRPADRVSNGALGQVDPGRGLEERLGSGLPGEQRVVLVLEARGTGPRRVDLAEHRARRAIPSGSTRFGGVEEGDPRQVVGGKGVADAAPRPGWPAARTPRAGAARRPAWPRAR